MTQPFCTNCGIEMPSGARFCADCGHSVAPEDPASRARSAASRDPNRVSSPKWWILLSILMAIVTAGATYAVLNDSGAPDTEEVDQTSIPVAATETTEGPSSTLSREEAMPTTTEPSAFTDAQIAERFGDAVYRVETSGCGYESSGSAFVIGEHHLVTNAHVVENDSQPTLVSRDGQRIRGRVIGFTANPDVAVIEVSSRLTPVLEWAPTSTLTEGDRLLALGYPVPGTDFSATPGAIVSFRTADGFREAIRTDANLDRGNSGGPALTIDGLVAGVVTEMEANSSGFQFVPLVYTSAVLRSIVEDAIASPNEIRVECGSAVFSDPADDPEDDGYPSPYDPFWTVVLASVDYLTENFDDAVERADDLWALGVPVDILLSDDFPSLNPGYWVVYSGRFGTEAEARSYCQDIKPVVGSCYQRLVSWDSSQR